MDRTRCMHILLAALVVATAVMLAGCAGASSPKSTAAPAGGSVSAVKNTVARPTSSATGSVDTTEARALGAQIDAIENELESFGLPGDESIQAIESGLK